MLFSAPKLWKESLTGWCCYVPTIKGICPRWGWNSQPLDLSSTYTAFKYFALTDCAPGAIMPCYIVVLFKDNAKNHVCFMKHDENLFNNTQIVLEN